MAKNKTFIDFWFEGFSSSLDLLASDERQKIFTECGKSCSESMTLKMYQDAYKNAGNDLGRCTRLLEEQCPDEIAYYPVDEPGVPEGKCYDVEYKKCLCPIVAEGYITNPALCECSRQSILYNWEMLVGKGNVSVEKLQSILGGFKTCKFRVTFR